MDVRTFDESSTGLGREISLGTVVRNVLTASVDVAKLRYSVFSNLPDCLIIDVFEWRKVNRALRCGRQTSPSFNSQTRPLLRMSPYTVAVR